MLSANRAPFPSFHHLKWGNFIINKSTNQPKRENYELIWFATQFTIINQSQSYRKKKNNQSQSKALMCLNGTNFRPILQYSEKKKKKLLLAAVSI